MSESSLQNSDIFSFKYSGCDVVVTLSEGYPDRYDSYQSPQPEITEVAISDPTNNTLLEIDIPDSVIWMHYERRLRDYNETFATSYY